MPNHQSRHAHATSQAHCRDHSSHHHRRARTQPNRALRHPAPPRIKKTSPPCGPIRAFSYGGWQSTAALVLAAQGHIDFRTFLFANVGDDSEHPATLAYIRDHAALRRREWHRIARTTPHPPRRHHRNPL
jgi:hypothetical protein